MHKQSMLLAYHTGILSQGVEYSQGGDGHAQEALAGVLLRLVEVQLIAALLRAQSRPEGLVGLGLLHLVNIAQPETRHSTAKLTQRTAKLTQRTAKLTQRTAQQSSLSAQQSSLSAQQSSLSAQHSSLSLRPGTAQLTHLDASTAQHHSVQTPMPVKGPGISANMLYLRHGQSSQAVLSWHPYPC
jgi:hypothetical protein